MLTESLTLAAAGGALGVALAYGLLEALKRFGPPDVRRLDRAALDGSVLLVTAGATVVTGLLLGLAPAMLAARRTLANSLREGGRGSSAGTRTNRLRDVGKFEQIVLVALRILGENAYGISVQEEVEKLSKRFVSLGAVYTTLDRLETLNGEFFSANFSEAAA